MKNPFLIGQRIYLRPLEENDISRQLMWLNDEEVCRYSDHHVFPYTQRNAMSYLQDIQTSSNSLVLGIVLKGCDLHIGNAILQNIHQLYRSAEYTIIIGEKQYWGQGYSKEASSLLVHHGFMTLNLHRIYCSSFADNLAMIKLASFLGMREEGRRKEASFRNGKYIDVIEFGTLRDEFFKNRKNGTANLQ